MLLTIDYVHYSNPFYKQSFRKAPGGVPVFSEQVQEGSTPNSVTCLGFYWKSCHDTSWFDTQEGRNDKNVHRRRLKPGQRSTATHMQSWREQISRTTSTGCFTYTPQQAGSCTEFRACFLNGSSRRAPAQLAEASAMGADSAELTWEEQQS